MRSMEIVEGDYEGNGNRDLPSLSERGRTVAYFVMWKAKEMERNDSA
jgi:hypothetical protein